MFGKNKVLALNIANGRLSASALSISKKGTKVEFFAVYPISSKAIDLGAIVQGAEVQAVLHMCFQELPAAYTKKKTQVFLSFNHPEAFVKRLALPYEKDAVVFRRQIRLELEQYAVGDFSKMTFGYQLEQVDEVAFVLAAIAPNAVVSSYIDLVKAQGMKNISVSLSSLGSCNYAFYSKPEFEEQKLLVIDLYKDMSEVSLWSQGTLESYVVLSYGTSFFDGNIAAELNVSLSEAESLRKAHCRGEPAPEQLAQILSENAEFFIDEIRTQAFRSSKFKVDAIFLSSEGSSLKELTTLLKSRGRVFLDLDSPAVDLSAVDVTGNAMYLSNTVGTGLQAVIK